MFNAKVGPPPAGAAGVDIAGLSANIWKSWSRYVDAIVIPPDRLIAIEAKIMADVGAVSQLELYAQLIPKTADLAQYVGRPIELRIVTASADPEFVSFAQSKGIGVDVYRPPWAVDYIYQLTR